MPHWLCSVGSCNMARFCFSSIPFSLLQSRTRLWSGVRAIASQRGKRRTFVSSLQSATAVSSKSRTISAKPHEPVLLSQVLDHFSGAKIGTFLDCTVGAGGHASALLSNCEIERYIGLDKDENALSIARKALSGHTIVSLLHSDFRDLSAALEHADCGSGEIDGALIDLGVSSMQLDNGERGFSFMRDGPLDMRMDEHATIRTAADIVNCAPEEELADLFWRYADDTRSRMHASRIVEARSRAPITTTLQLAEVLLRPGEGRGKMHPATLPFQALRIAVNAEIEAVESVLPQLLDALRPGGTACVISFHSIEDRVVKNVFRDCEVVGGVDILTRKPVVAGKEEVRRNVRSRSAKMRIVRKLGEGESPKRFKKNKYR